MIARAYVFHDIVICNASANGQHSTRHRFAHNENIGADIFPVNAHHLACSAEASLNFIGAHQYVILCAEFSYLLDVSLFRYYYSTFALNGFNENGADVRIRPKSSFEIGYVIVVE